MAWADRLLRLATGDPKREVVEHLSALHRGSSQQEQRLAAGAAQAPNAGSEVELRALAAGRHQLTADLAQALQAREAAVSDTAPTVPLNGGAPNHWARLVAALEAGQHARAQLARESPRLLGLDASLAELLDALDRRLHIESLALRALIARADPQALN